MVKKSLILFILLFSFLLASPAEKAFAIEDPLKTPNNKIGIHILFDNELPQAAKLVNSNGGDWGYVLIPIQANDRDLVKWQRFMDTAKKNHVIPILRLATEGDYFNTAVWRKPDPTDIIDFANFLNSLDWPVKNRYVIIFNEVNRGDEWGGAADPEEYADLLSFAVSVFKSKDQDFFVIGAGLDNAAPNQGTTYMNEYSYMTAMNAAVPGIFNQIDGLASHSYPNPGFSQAPDPTSTEGVGSFVYERQLVKQLNGKDLPVFITETGWDGNIVSDDQRAQYYQTALQTIWNDPHIVAITPFLLQSWAGPFDKFTFINKDGSTTKQYQMLQSIAKTRGKPTKEIKVLAAETKRDLSFASIKPTDFSKLPDYHRRFSIVNTMQTAFSFLMGI